MITQLVGRLYTGTLVVFFFCFGFSSTKSLKAEDTTTNGTVISLPEVLEDRTFEAIKIQIERIRNVPNRNIRSIIIDFNPNQRDSSTKNYGAAYNLSIYLRNLSLNQQIRTIAFVHGKVTGHLVLPALACNDLVMSSDAKIGQVVEPNDPPLSEKSEIDYYLKLAGSRGVLVQKMFDKNVRVMTGLLNQSIIYFDQRQMNKPEYQNVHNPKLVSDLTPGEVAFYSAPQAMKYELCKVILESMADVLNRYNLSEEITKDETIANQNIKACTIELIGSFNLALKDKLSRQLREAVSNRENTIFFVLECSDGDYEVAYEIAKMILEVNQDKDNPIRTIAFVRDRVPDLGAFVAFACEDIVMNRGGVEKGNGADQDLDIHGELGDFESFALKKINMDIIRKQLREIIDTGKRYDPMLVDAMLRYNSAIIRVKSKKNGQIQLMTRQEFDQVKTDWDHDGSVKEAGTWFKITPGKAKELKITNLFTKGRDLKLLYDLYQIPQKEVRFAEPHWLDSFAAFLRRTDISILLIMIGVAGLILELKVPGLTVPGIIALICFVLFFWAQSRLNQQIINLAILLFIAGIVLIGVEIFITPGFGIPGISGILLVIIGLGLATIDRIPTNTEQWVDLTARVVRYGLTMVGGVCFALMFARYLPKIPYANRLMLTPPSELPGEEITHLPGSERAQLLLGKIGVATSMLRPAGMAKFEDDLVDVVTEGDYIPPGTPIQVIEVEGTRIVVKSIALS